MNAAVERLVLVPSRPDAKDTYLRPDRVLVYAACTILAVAQNYFFGKEMASDTLNYHLYAGFSALNDRFDQDYFAAGPQSYFNPYAYAPFYILVKLGLPALAIGTILAMVQSVVLWITYELACTVWPSGDRRQRFFFGLCVTTLAFMNPILLQQFGSAFADITTAGVVLGGWLLLAQAVQVPSTKRVIFSGVVLGIATALKQTNAVHALAGFFVLIFVPLPPRRRIRSLAYFGVALATGFAITAAPWSYRLANMFGNPFFPFFNPIFKSAEFTTAPLLKHYRFIPDSLVDALLRPFSIASTSDMVHAELRSPDIRYALLLMVLLVLFVSWIWRSAAGVPTQHKTPRYESPTRVLAALGCGFAVDWIIWLSGSGNGRYLIPMACVAAVIALALLFRLLANHIAGRNALLVTLFVAQAIQLCVGTQYRWNYAPWEGRWFNVVVPEKLAKEPNLYLSIGMQSDSFIVPFLARGSGFVNFSGAYTLGPDGANASHVRSMIERSAPHIRVLVNGEKIYPDSARREPRQSDVDDALRSFSLRVDMNDCETITVQGLRSNAWRAFGSSIPGQLPPPLRYRYLTHLASCHVVADNRDAFAEESARRTVDLVLNRVEDACPSLFQPPRRQTEHQNQAWFRVYLLTDLTAWVSNGEVKFIDPTRGPHEVSLGREEDWARVPLSLDCGRRHGVYFAKTEPTATAAGQESGQRHAVSR
jgi:hypothetical protein